MEEEEEKKKKNVEKKKKKKGVKREKKKKKKKIPMDNCEKGNVHDMYLRTRLSMQKRIHTHNTCAKA